VKKRNSKLYLKDILEAIQKINNYTKNLSFEEFSQNTMVVDAVIRNFEIIGEATKHIPEEIRKSYPEIPWKEMAGMRDKMIHEYFGVDLEIVWKTIKIRLPQILPLLGQIYGSVKE